MGRIIDDPFAQAPQKRIIDDPFAQPNKENAVDLLLNGFDQRMSPEQRTAVDSSLNGQDKVSEQMKAVYSNRDGIDYSGEMTTARNKSRYGSNATSQVALEMDKKAAQYKEGKFTDVMKTAGASFIEAAGDVGRYVSESFISYFHGPELKYWPTAAAQNEVAILEEKGLPTKYDAVARTAGKRIGETIKSIKPDEWEEARGRAHEIVGGDKAGWFEKGIILLADNAPMLIASAMNPSAGYLTSFSTMTASHEKELLSAGISEDVSANQSAVYGMIAGAIEYSENFSRIGSAFGKTGNPVSKVIISKLKNAGINVGEEVLQEFLSNVSYNYAAINHNEKNEKQIELKGLTDEFGSAAEGSLAMTIVLESLGLSAKGLRKGIQKARGSAAANVATEKTPLSLGDFNEIRANNTDEQIIEMVESDPETEGMPEAKALKVEAALVPNEENSNAYNEEVFVAYPGRMMDEAVKQYDAEQALSDQEVGQGIADALNEKEQAPEQITGEEGIAEISDKAQKILNTGEKVKDFFDPSLRLTTRVGKISPKIKSKLRSMEQQAHLMVSEMNVRSAEFTKSYKDVYKGLDETQKQELDSAIHNFDFDKMESMGIKGSKDIGKALNEIGTRLGLSVDQMIENYFPRVVKDYEGLLDYLGSKPKGVFAQAIADAEKKKGKALTKAERDKAIESVFKSRGEGLPFRKHRTIDEVTPELSQFYENPIVTLQGFISRASDVIAKKETFNVDQEMTNTFDLKNIEGLKESVATIIAEELGDDALSTQDQKKLGELVQSRLEMRGTGKLTKTYNRLVYVKYVTNFKTAIKQFGDVAVSMAENGMQNTLTSGDESSQWSKDFGNEAKTFMEAIGINTIDAEFSDINKSRIEELLFKPLQMADVYNKEILASSTIKKWRMMESSALETEMLDLIGDPDLSAKITNDISEGTFSKEVSFALYSKISDFHPVSRSEHMKAYIDVPQARLLFTLKSFAISRWDRFYRETISEYTDGVSMARAGAVDGNTEMRQEGARKVATASINLGKFIAFTVGVEVIIDKSWEAVMKSLGFRDEPESDEEQWERSFSKKYLDEIGRIFPWVDSYTFESAWDKEAPFEELFKGVMEPVKPLGFDTMTSLLKTLKDDEGRGIDEFDQWKKDLPYIGSEWYKRSHIDD